MRIPWHRFTNIGINREDLKVVFYFLKVANNYEKLDLLTKEMENEN